MLSALALVVALRQDPGTTPSVTFQSDGARIEVIAEQLQKQTGTRLFVAPNLRGEVFAVRVSNVPLKSLLDRIGKTMYAEWTPVDGGFRLEQSNVLRLAEERDTQALKVAAMQKHLDEQVKAMGGATGSEDEYRKIASQMQEHLERMARTEDHSGWEQFGRLTARLPNARLRAMVGRSLNPVDLVRIRPGERVVFSTMPTPMQRRLPAAASQALQQFSAEQAKWARAVQAVRRAAPKPDPGSEGLPEGMSFLDNYLGNVPSGGYSKINVAVTRRRQGFFTGGGLEAEMMLLDRRGRLMARESLSLSDGLDEEDLEPMKPEPNEKPIVLKPAIKALLAMASSMGEDMDEFKVPAELKGLLADPVKVEPLSVVAGDLVLGTWTQGNLVARLDDAWAYGAFIGMMQGGGPGEPTPSIVRNSLKFMQTKVVSEEGWTLLVPTYSLDAREGRVDRTQLRTLTEPIAAGRSVTLEELANYAANNDSIMESPMGFTVLLLIGPDMSAIPIRTNWSVLRFYGRLSGQQRMTLRQGGTLVLGTLTPPQQEALVQMVYWQPATITESLPPNRREALARAESGFVPPDPTVQEESGEPDTEVTQLLPNGIPPQSLLRGQFTTDAVFKTAGPFQQVHTAENLGAMLAYQEHAANQGSPMPQRQRLERVTVGTRGTIDLAFQFGPRQFYRQALLDDAFGTNTVAITALPKPILDRINASRLAILERLKNAPGNMPDDDTPPTPPPAR